MICRQCLRRATTLVAHRPAVTRPLSTFPVLRNAAEAASSPTPAPEGEPAAKPKSACPAGTVLVGLNYFKGKQDPVALADEEYPDWLWRCLDLPDRAVNAEDAAAAEFCKAPPVEALLPLHFLIFLHPQLLPVEVAVGDRDGR